MAAISTPHGRQLAGPAATPRANVLGVGIHAVNLPMALELTERLLVQGRQAYICLSGVHGVMQALDDLEFRAILNSAYLNLPDGMPTVWVGKMQRQRSMDRVFGPDFMLALCDKSQEKGWTHYLYGGDVGIAEKLAASLLRLFPALKIVGAETPPFRPLTESEECDFRSRLQALHPHIVWVGISTPKQERFMARHLPSVHAQLMVGVGAAFDFHSGRIKDAPAWMKVTGLQWLHRLGQDPGRLWKRYLYNNPRFVYHSALQFWRPEKYELAPRINGGR